MRQRKQISLCTYVFFPLLILRSEMRFSSKNQISNQVPLISQCKLVTLKDYRITYEAQQQQIYFCLPVIGVEVRVFRCQEVPRGSEVASGWLGDNTKPFLRKEECRISRYLLKEKIYEKLKSNYFKKQCSSSSFLLT